MTRTSDPESASLIEVRDFTEFYRHEYRAVLGLAIAMTRDRWAAEDLTQEAFSAAERSWSRVSTLDRPEAWVRRVIANKSVSRWRRIASEMKALSRYGGGSTRADDPAFSAETAELWSVVRSLPKRQAQVLALTYLDDLTTAQVGQILECSPATVKTHLQRGRAAVAHKLGLEEVES